MQENSAITHPELRCTHLHPTGLRCRSFALRGEPFCYHHHPSRPLARHSRAAAVSEPFHLPVLSSRRAVQIADNTLDTKRAGLLLQVLQTAAAAHST